MSENVIIIITTLPSSWTRGGKAETRFLLIMRLEIIRGDGEMALVLEKCS